MRRNFLVSCIFAVACFAGSASAQQVRATIHNQSDWEIHQVHVSTASNPEDFTGDLLGSDEVVAPGQDLVVTISDCGDYHLAIMDETGDWCTTDAISLCGDHEGTLTNANLQACVDDTDQD